MGRLILGSDRQVDAYNQANESACVILREIKVQILDPNHVPMDFLFMFRTFNYHHWIYDSIGF